MQPRLRRSGRLWFIGYGRYFNDIDNTLQEMVLWADSPSPGDTFKLKRLANTMNVLMSKRRLFVEMRIGSKLGDSVAKSWGIWTAPMSLLG
jgi:hypothetical protein